MRKIGFKCSATGPLYVFEGYTINEPWVIMLALAHNYERLKQVPSDETNGVGLTSLNMTAGISSRVTPPDSLPSLLAYGIL